MDHSAQDKQDISMIRKHDELSSLIKLGDDEKKAAREEHELSLQKLKATGLPADTYENLCRSMADGLKWKLHELENSHHERIQRLLKAHREERTQHERINGQQVTVSSPPADTPRSHGPNDNSNLARDGPRLQDSDQLLKPTKSSPSTVRHEEDDGWIRLMTRVQSNKRKIPSAEESDSKRLRIDTAVNHLRTPMATPPTENPHMLEKTVTFDEVYQNGKATHIDTIVEWPPRSDKWYILKCEQHDIRFSDRPIQGAAKHLNAKVHGVPDRNWNRAVEMLGHRVLNCTRELANMNNRAALLTYPKKQDKLPTRPKGEKQDGKDSESGKPSLSSRAYHPIPARKTAMPERRSPKGKAKEVMRAQDRGGTLSLRKTDTPTRAQNETTTLAAPEQERPNSERQLSKSGITHPKTFHIYYGYWRETKLVYPVMILGWDDQEEGGLKGDLVSTRLLHKSSDPPRCYVYRSNKIVAWAPGYEDGGSKVGARKFPVMFFDESQSAGWMSARDLSKFPLYSVDTHKEDDHPSNVARNWIARREGFLTWEDREAARVRNGAGQSAPEGQVPRASPTNSSDRSPAGERLSIPRDTNSHANPGELDPDSEQESDAESDAESTFPTDEMLQEWIEKAGEIPGDEDYEGSELEGNADSEVDDWDEPLSSKLKPDGSRSRPWAFYGLRSTKDDDAKAANSTPVMYNENVNTSIFSGMNSARQLSKQATSSSITYLSVTDTQANIQSGRPTLPDSTKEMLEMTGDSSRQSLSGTTSKDRAFTPSRDSGPRAQSMVSASPTSTITARPSAEDRAASLPPLRPDHPTTPYAPVSKAVSKENTSTGADEPTRGEKEDCGKDDRRSELRQPTPAANRVNLGVRTADKQPPTITAPSPRVPTPTPSASHTITLPAPTPTPSASPAIIPPVCHESPSEVAFELTLYRRGTTEWTPTAAATEEDGEELEFINLYYGPDNRTVNTRHGAPVAITIDPTTVEGYARKRDIPGTAGPNGVTLIFMDGAGPDMQLYFEKNRRNTLLGGRAQARGFIRWMRRVKQEIRCVDLD
ncbi:hypothetical protein F5B20DRAFT_583812 [Whalleya microplaca]|nr:hypothetical protein F5B20DRAFT_583812 [Whalleya microplaca]